MNHSPHMSFFHFHLIVYLQCHTPHMNEAMTKKTFLIIHRFYLFWLQVNLDQTCVFVFNVESKKASGKKGVALKRTNSTTPGGAG